MFLLYLYIFYLSIILCFIIFFLIYLVFHALPPAVPQKLSHFTQCRFLLFIAANVSGKVVFTTSSTTPSTTARTPAPFCCWHDFHISQRFTLFTWRANREFCQIAFAFGVQSVASGGKCCLAHFSRDSGSYSMQVMLCCHTFLLSFQFLSALKKWYFYIEDIHCFFFSKFSISG